VEVDVVSDLCCLMRMTLTPSHLASSAASHWRTILRSSHSWADLVACWQTVVQPVFGGLLDEVTCTVQQAFCHACWSLHVMLFCLLSWLKAEVGEAGFDRLLSQLLVDARYMTVQGLFYG